MKMRAAAGLAAFLAACLCNTSVMAEAPMPLGDVHIFGGGKIMNKDDWAPADQETEFGGEVDFQPHSWPIALTAAYFSGRGSGAMDPSVAYDAYGNAYVFGDFKSETSEIQLGVKKFWSNGNFGRPYVGGGLAQIHAKATLDCQTGGVDCTASYSDSATGVWAGGGFIYTFGHFDLGVDMRYSYAQVTIVDVKGNGGGLHIGAIAGFHF